MVVGAGLRHVVVGGVIWRSIATCLPVAGKCVSAGVPIVGGGSTLLSLGGGIPAGIAPPKSSHASASLFIT